MIDWRSVRLDYISSNDSLRDVAKRHGISSGTILARAAADGWTDEKHRLQSDAYQIAKTDAQSSLASQLRKASDHELSVASQLRILLNDMVSECKSPSDVKTCGQALETLQRVARTALGVPQLPTSTQTLHTQQDLREASTDELLQSLLTPEVVLMMTQHGISPGSMSDDDLIHWLSVHAVGRVQ